MGDYVGVDVDKCKPPNDVAAVGLYIMHFSCRVAMHGFQDKDRFDKAASGR